MNHPSAHRIIGLYDEKAESWIADRGRDLRRGGPGVDEAGWLDRFTATLPPGARILDAGCGSGWPVGAALLAKGFRVTGLDASPRLIAHARKTLPNGGWVVGDIRAFDLGRAFDGVLAWFSLFHLTPDDQRRALGRLLAHAGPAATMLFTSGPQAGEDIGEWRGEPLYHASLDPADYRDILQDAGFSVEVRGPGDAEGVGGLVWLARREAE